MPDTGWQPDSVSPLANGCAIPDTAGATIAELRQWCECESRKAKPMEATERSNNEMGEVRAKLEVAVEKAKAVCQRLEEQTIEASKVADNAIRQHPYQSIGIAFGTGVLFGMLAMRCGKD